MCYNKLSSRSCLQSRLIDHQGPAPRTRRIDTHNRAAMASGTCAALTTSFPRPGMRSPRPKQQARFPQNLRQSSTNAPTNPAERNAPTPAPPGGAQSYAAVTNAACVLDRQAHPRPQPDERESVSELRMRRTPRRCAVARPADKSLRTVAHTSRPSPQHNASLTSPRCLYCSSVTLRR